MLLIRPCLPSDLDSVTAVYGWNVLHGTGTFELEPPDVGEMTRRFNDVGSKGLPWLVAEEDGRIVGYAYANHFRPRLAYRFCLEDSVYLAPDATGRGLGRLLLAELLARCEDAGGRQMLAVIGDSQNLGSIGLHRRLGFEDVGVMKAAGWKFDRWLDVVILQKALGAGRVFDPTGGRLTISMAAYRSKTLATWIAFLGGGLGLHRFYLHGLADRWGWLFPLPTLVGVYGVLRMRRFGIDDRPAWLLIPLLGAVISVAAVTAIVYGLTPDDRWNTRHNPTGPQHRTGWSTIIGVLAALVVGAGVLMATIAFSAQHYFEYTAPG